MNRFTRWFIKMKHMIKHKTLGSGPEKDEVHEAAMQAHADYKTRVKDLKVRTTDVQQQLAEAFLQLGRGAQRMNELVEGDVIQGSLGDRAKLLNATRRCEVTVGLMQEAFDESLGKGLQNALLTPLQSEIKRFEETKQAAAKRLATTLDAQYYAKKVQRLSESKGGAEKNKLPRNSEKSAKAADADAAARTALVLALNFHDEARLEIFDCQHIGELNNTLYRFDELVLGALAVGDIDVGRRADGVVLESSNKYGQLSQMAVHLTKHVKLDDSSSEPLELEVNVMARRYCKAFGLYEGLLGTLKAAKRWFGSAFTALDGVAVELDGLLKSTDADDSKANVRSFCVMVEEFNGNLTANLTDPLQILIDALEESCREYRPLAARLKDRKDKANRVKHYAVKVASLEDQNMRLYADHKASDKAKEDSDEAVRRNKMKACEAKKQALEALEECRVQLVAFDHFFKDVAHRVHSQFSSLQRNFSIQFCASRVAADDRFLHASSPPWYASACDAAARGLLRPQREAAVEARRLVAEREARQREAQRLEAQRLERLEAQRRERETQREQQRAAQPPRETTEDCPICRERIEGAKTHLSCMHAFCTTCIERWIQQHPSCPICRVPVS